MEPPCKSEKNSLVVWNKKLNIVFLERDNLQLLRLSILLVVFRVFAMLEVQNHKFQSNSFQESFFSVWSQETKVVNIWYPQTAEKSNIYLYD